MVGINVPIPVPVAYYSFGGWKASLFGDTHMYGPRGRTSTPGARSSPRAGPTRPPPTSTSASRSTRPASSPGGARRRRDCRTCRCGDSVSVEADRPAQEPCRHRRDPELPGAQGDLRRLLVPRHATRREERREDRLRPRPVLPRPVRDRLEAHPLAAERVGRNPAGGGRRLLHRRCALLLRGADRARRRAASGSRRASILGDPGYEFQRVEGNTSILSADDRFAYAFTAFAGSGLPLQIWTINANGVLTNITRTRPDLIKKDAAMWWHTYVAGRGKSEYGDVRGLVSAWCADEYLLGEKAACDAEARKTALPEGLPQWVGLLAERCEVRHGAPSLAGEMGLPQELNAASSGATSGAHSRPRVKSESVRAPSGSRPVIRFTPRYQTTVP